MALAIPTSPAPTPPATETEVHSFNATTPATTMTIEMIAAVANWRVDERVVAKRRARVAT